MTLEFEASSLGVKVCHEKDVREYCTLAKDTVQLFKDHLSWACHIIPYTSFKETLDWRTTKVIKQNFYYIKVNENSIFSHFLVNFVSLLHVTIFFSFFLWDALLVFLLPFFCSQKGKRRRVSCWPFLVIKKAENDTQKKFIYSAY